jgi:hypothetical protein
VLTALTLRSASVVGHIDEITVVGGDEVPAQALPRGAYVAARGWLVNPADELQPDALEISIGGGARIVAALSLPRPDVAAQFETNVTNCGFYGVGPVVAACGEQRIAAWARFGDRRVPLACDGSVTVVPTSDPLRGLIRRDEGWAASADGFTTGAEGADIATDGGIAVVPYDRPISLRMWCIDLTTKRAPAALVARMGGTYLSVIAGQERLDVAEHFRAPDAVHCGFLVPALAPLVGAGKIELFAIFADGTYGALPPVRFRRPESLPYTSLPDNAEITGRIDEVRADGVVLSSAGEVTIARGQTVSIRGWAIDANGPRLTSGLQAEIDGNLYAESRPGTPRPDVAAFAENSAVSDCEFLLDFGTLNLEPRVYKLTLWGVSARHDARGRLESCRLVVRAAESPPP